VIPKDSVMTMLGLKIGSWFGKDSRRQLDLEPGAVFRKVRPDNLVEKATVLSITKDTFGIPHVRFDIALESPSHLRLTDNEQRLLCLQSFTEHFPERVPA
jgi:hypothetical protein